ncbi:Plastid division protein PDV2 [Ananas comosus]|uniref:Plastid division protein PDV2 n=1 Tax=Ananas comosus TaxID=4615 RepID=A0A199W8X2_ANACO|nr:Plastid division protein PDV2 [Ananas comosus]
MEGEEIGLVLARASELRTKITDCIGRGGGDELQRGRRAEEDEEERGGEGVEEEEEEEAESLLSIRDALESLEQQLASLQALQQQQRYERESILNQIDRSRRILLTKLRSYKGQDWEVIHEAAAFAGEKVEHDEGLILPPYPTHLTNSFVLDDLYPPDFSFKSKLARNGSISEPIIHEANKRRTGEPEKNGKSAGIRFLFGWFAKSVITVVSVLSMLKLAGYKPTMGKGGIKFEARGLFGKAAGDEGADSLECPPGKVLVIEDGKARCLVKERVEIPFESDVTAPNVRYGFG